MSLEGIDMSKIRFEDVTITAKAIELDGIKDPSGFMKGLGLNGADVKEGVEYKTDAVPPIEPNIIIPSETPPAVQIEEEAREEVVEERPRLEITPAQFTKARRLRDVVQVFMDANITDVDEIVDTCVLMKSKVSILGRMADIPGRMPIAVNTWLEQNAQ